MVSFLERYTVSELNVFKNQAIHEAINTIPCYSI